MTCLILYAKLRIIVHLLSMHLLWKRLLVPFCSVKNFTLKILQGAINTAFNRKRIPVHYYTWPQTASGTDDQNKILLRRVKFVVWGSVECVTTVLWILYKGRNVTTHITQFNGVIKWLTISRSGAAFTKLDWIKSQHGKVITCPLKCGMKLLIHFQTSTAVPLKFGNN